MRNKSRLSSLGPFFGIGRKNGPKTKNFENSDFADFFGPIRHKKNILARKKYFSNIATPITLIFNMGPFFGMAPKNGPKKKS